MNIVHVGPPLARRGGPSGYLWQLAAAAETCRRAGSHVVSYPEPERPRPPSAPATSRDRVRRIARRTRRAVLGPPVQYRPSDADIRRPNGAIGSLVAASLQQMCLDAAPSIDAALASPADVLFAHDAAVAERLLQRRRPGRQVWLFIHTPMPLALYLAWSWGVPERCWEDLMVLPDTDRWSAWEIDVCSRVDRLVFPCEEAAGELARADPRFGSLARADMVLTGGSGPARRFPLERARQLRDRFGLPTGVPLGLYLGSAQPYRGLDALVEGVRLLPRGISGAVVVAGPPPDAVARHRRIIALGPVGDVADLLQAVDFVVNVNRFSLFDLSAIEAAEAGRPMLLHATGGNRRLAALGAGAVMLKDLEPATVSAGLAELFSAPHDELLALSARSRRCWEQHLRPEHLWQRHTELYDRAAAGAAV
jgi:glycosyltransferase involved in cell wall biosynthesis